MKTMTDPRCGKVSRANDTDGHCTNCHLTWSGETAFTHHQHITDGVLSCEDPLTATTPKGEQKWWPRQRPGTSDGVAWGLGAPGWWGTASQTETPDPVELSEGDAA